MALGSADIALLVLSVLASAGIGIYFSVTGRKSTPLEYLLGGRNMKPLPLALSMMVGTVSAITIMGNSGEMYAYGTQLWVMDLGIILGLIIIAKVFIPIMYPLKMVSLYQYVERRFESRPLRQATVLLQLVGGYMYIGFLLFPPSIALEKFTGLLFVYNIIIIGATCTLYSAFGGVKAVVYTDVLQSLVMVVGVLAIVIQGSAASGGLGRVIDRAYHKDRIEFFNMNLDPYQRHSFWLCIVLGFFFTMGTYGVNQSQTQRFFSTGSVSQAQWVLYYAAMGMIFLRALIHLSGLVMFVHYEHCDPISNPAAYTDPAAVAIYYVIEELTKAPGLAGLFVAAVYAAVLSSVSTQLNSMTALLWEDFLKTLPVFNNWSEVKIGSLQKIIVLLTGVLGIVLGLVVSQLGWSFLTTALAVNGALSGPVIGLFLTAVFLPWVNSKGASAGFLLSIIVTVIMVVGQQLSMPKAGFLPLSRDGCDAPTNISMANEPISLDTTIAIEILTTTIPTTITDITNVSTTIPPAMTVTSAPAGAGFFGLSYCLNSLWGTLLCIIISVVVTAITGFNTPKDVEEKLISPGAWKLFQRSLSQQIYEFFCFKILCREPPLPTPVNSDHGVNDPLNNLEGVSGSYDIESKGNKSAQ